MVSSWHRSFATSCLGLPGVQCLSSGALWFACRNQSGWVGPASADRDAQSRTPVNWKFGDDVIITPVVSNEEAAKSFPGFKTIKPYLRSIKQPS